MKKKVVFIGATFALILLILADCVSRDNFLGEFSPKYQLQKWELKKEIQAVTKEYQANNAAILKEFEQELASIGRADFRLAQARVNYVTRELTSYKSCAIICCKFIKDKIGKSQDASKYIQSIVGPNLLTPCSSGNAKINEHLKRFQHKLQENNNRYNATLAQMVKERKNIFPSSRSRDEFIKNNINIHALSNQIAVSKVLAGVGTIVEVIFIKGTVKMIGRAFAHVTAKLASCGSAAAASALADGPLPIGDIIGAGIGIAGLAWTAHDLYKVHVTLPRKMRSSLTEMIQKYESTSKQEALQVARASVQAFNKESDQKIKLL